MKQLERRISVQKIGGEPLSKPFYMTVTPPTGSQWVGIRHAPSAEKILQDYLRDTNLSRREVAGRVCLTLLRPPKGKEYLDTDLTIMPRFSSKEDFLRKNLISVS